MTIVSHIRKEEQVIRMKQDKDKNLNCFYCDEITTLIRKIRHKGNALYILYCDNCYDYYVYMVKEGQHKPMINISK